MYYVGSLSIPLIDCLLVHEWSARVSCVVSMYTCMHALPLYLRVYTRTYPIYHVTISLLLFPLLVLLLLIQLLLLLLLSGGHGWSCGSSCRVEWRQVVRENQGRWRRGGSSTWREGTTTRPATRGSLQSRQEYKNGPILYKISLNTKNKVSIDGLLPSIRHRGSHNSDKTPRLQKFRKLFG